MHLVRRFAVALLVGLGLLERASPARALEVAGPALDAAPAPAPAVVAESPKVSPPPNDTDPVPVALGVVAIAFGLADLGFGIYDTAKLANGLRPARGVAIAEAVVASPQVLVYDIMIIAVSAANEGERSYLAGLVFLPGVANSLFVHGIWGAETTIARPEVLYGVSAAVGFDTAFTGAILGRLAGGHLSGTAMGVTQMVLTAPQIAASAYGIVKDPHNAGGWGALAGWSGAIFAHGLVSTILGGRYSPPEPPMPPPEMPPVPPRPTLLVPASIHVGPVPIAGGGGIGVSGRWL